MDYKDNAHIQIYFKATTPNIPNRYKFRTLPKIRKTSNKYCSISAFQIPHKGIINISKLQKNIRDAFLKRTQQYQSNSKKRQANCNQI